jgi:hypothetical protein
MFYIFGSYRFFPGCWDERVDSILSEEKKLFFFKSSNGIGRCLVIPSDTTAGGSGEPSVLNFVLGHSQLSACHRHGDSRSIVYHSTSEKKKRIK